MEAMNTSVECLYCGGTGIYKDAPCIYCQGPGLTPKIITSKGFYNSVDILDCINFTEFTALSENNKRIVELIVSASHVNMNQDSAAMIRLFTCFPEGTVTCTALLALIGQ
jgi:hypothetical protein